MNRLPPIPTPPGQRWREVRIRIIPGLSFIAALALAVFLWRDNVASPTLEGAIEAVRAEVISPQAGTLTKITVARFQQVSQGDPVAVIHPTDPRTALDLLRAEIDLLRARLEPRLSQQRNSTDYERLRLELLLQKAELASDRVNLARAENELKRNQELFESKLLSEQLYDFSLKTKEQLETEVTEKAKLITDLEQGLQRLAALGDPDTASPTADAMLAAIQSQEQKLQKAQASIAPIVLTAPLDGVVSLVYRQEGENVMDGDPILVINSLESTRIIGYLRQPLPLEPEVGMHVEVRKRTPKAPAYHALIRHVGSQFEPITNALAMIRPGQAVDLGLPIEVSLPPSLKGRPGELVQLTLLPSKQ